jgi:hypothetical protein
VLKREIWSLCCRIHTPPHTHTHSPTHSHTHPNSPIPTVHTTHTTHTTHIIYLRSHTVETRLQCSFWAFKAQRRSTYLGEREGGGGRETGKRRGREGGEKVESY